MFQQAHFDFVKQRTRQKQSFVESTYQYGIHRRCVVRNAVRCIIRYFAPLLGFCTDFESCAYRIIKLNVPFYS